MRSRVILLTALVLAACGLVSAAAAQRLAAAPAPHPTQQRSILIAPQQPTPLGQQQLTMPAQLQPTVMSEASISLALATRMLEAMERRATELGVPVGLAIVDQSGRLKAFHRMDGSRPNHIDSAMNKAWTSVQYGRDNGELWERVQANPALFATVANVPHVDFTSGGRLLRVDGLVVGALGVAGGVAGQDDLIGDAALALLPQ